MFRMLNRSLSLSVLALVCSIAQAQEGQKPKVRGGVEGTIKAVDTESETLTITTTAGKVRSFHIKEDTKFVGPRGGAVPKRLEDPRFHEGLEVTVVLSGSTVKAVYLGVASGDVAEGGAPRAGGKMSVAGGRAEAGAPGVASTASGAMEPDAAGDEQPKPTPKVSGDKTSGTLKSFTLAKRVLVIADSAGKEHTYLLTAAVKIKVHGVVSDLGLKDPALQGGSAVSVYTEHGTRKVKEVHLTDAGPGVAGGRPMPGEAGAAAGRKPRPGGASMSGTGAE